MGSGERAGFPLRVRFAAWLSEWLWAIAARLSDYAQPIWTAEAEADMEAERLADIEAGIAYDDARHRAYNEGWDDAKNDSDDNDVWRP